MPRQLIRAIRRLPEFGDGCPPVSGTKVGQVPGWTRPRRLGWGAGRDLDGFQANPSRYPRSCHVIRGMWIDFPIMQTMRGRSSQPRISAEPGRPATVLESESPYGSRRVVVEYDSWTTAAYIHASSVPIAATWLANHRKAPADVNLTLLDSGQAPEMPEGHTKHPDGRPPMDPQALRAVWFEEGDGVALYEGSDLLAVIPGWSDMSKGMPGYSRDVIGQTPFAWSLDDAMEGLGPRVTEASDFWRWRLDPQG
jgi:hypothetical protein